ncbi:MAG: AfsR/SARP family transcriptional regulator [Acidimicrobiales bacterium]
MATYSSSLKRFANGPLHGTGLALYFILLPYVVLSKWGPAGEQTHATLVRGLLVCLALFWFAFLGQLGRNVARLRHGTGISTSGSAWLAGLIVALLSFLMPGFLHASAATPHAQASLTTRVNDAVSTSWRERRPLAPDLSKGTGTTPRRPTSPPPNPRGSVSVLSALPMALVAKRRHDELRQHQFECPDDQVDELIDALRSLDPHLIARLRFLIGAERSGVIHISGALESGELSLDSDPLVGCLLATGEEAEFAFAREGGTLSVDPSWSDEQTMASIVALHDGRLAFVHSELELLRALATRALHSVTVIYLGSARVLDDELRASCVTLTTMTPRDTVDTGAVVTSDDLGVAREEVRVELLRASPVVIGLREPFASTLRRRCIEMVAYLALHHDEPITGERLRSRVLGYADVEASSRTLANTASAVRRSLGPDERGPLLHSVSSSGLYETHGVTSDVGIFHDLVVRARSLAVPEASVLAHQALQLVQGEPLASALRGFEWFLAEGHLAQLQRDGEYAALLLHHQATSHGDYELAFWSLQQGLRIDPFSDVLAETLARVPRLRQFGRDRPSRSQDESVGSGGTVVVGWSFNRLGDQVT